ncbi:hypothetical protein P879_06224 [Paragonimus westermani]|uniref:SAGA-associated factor 11 n=1 Tax=Paragonimus westermani TaxID=34504 RepID=A0A8T0DFL0_9TREM|nr:hypothetical protein P879_06224 [Paragonimus westermani]
MANERDLESPHLLPLLRELVDELIDSCILDGILTMHRAIKLGYFHVIAPEAPAEEERTDCGAGPNSTGRDNSTKTTGCCRCVKCHSKVAATRFAPHLSNCMGLGRNSSRRANKRIAEQQRLEDYEDDYEDEFLQVPYFSSSSALHPSASDSALTRHADKQHSPLKLTISLVSNAGKTDAPAKHMIRAVNGAPIPDAVRGHSDSSKSANRLANHSGRSGLGSKTQTSTLLSKSAEAGIVLKEAKVSLVDHELTYSMGKRD